MKLIIPKQPVGTPPASFDFTGPQAQRAPVQCFMFAAEGGLRKRQFITDGGTAHRGAAKNIQIPAVRNTRP